MLYPLIPNRRRFAAYRLWIRTIVPLLILSALIPTNTSSVPKVHAMTSYSCSDCLATTYWPGATLGAISYISMYPMSCINCGGTNDYIMNELRVTDTNNGGYVEIGYRVLDDNVNYYYYCNNPPGNNLPYYSGCSNIGPVPSTDWNANTGFKVTLNRLGAGYMLVQLWSGGSPGYGWNATISNNMGGRYGTSDAYIGTQIDLGSKLNGSNLWPYTSVDQRINPDTWWIQSNWESSDRAYHVQTSAAVYNPPQSPLISAWSPNASPSNPGGDYYTWCSCN